MSTPLVDSAHAHPDDDPSPSRSVVLCTAPGAGDEVVAGILEQCGAGVPRAYFDVDRVARDLLAQWEVAHLDEYVGALHRHRTTAAGVFGLVLPWHDLRRLHRQVAGLRQPTAARMLEIVQTVAPQPTFVRLRRADRDQQVEALLAARQGPTEVVDATGRPPDGRADVERLRTMLDATDAVWSQWFDAVRIQPLEVTYERLVDDPAARADLAAHLELPIRSGR